MYLPGIGNFETLGETSAERFLRLAQERIKAQALAPILNQIAPGAGDDLSPGTVDKALALIQSNFRQRIDQKPVTATAFPWLLVLAGGAGLYFILRRRPSPRFGRR